ncbi:MAG: hypothetical protein KDK34_00220 [Leptospiraceae bacterium]|nr:hypothetical protein [Leptospiraceae bacterium]
MQSLLPDATERGSVPRRSSGEIRPSMDVTTNITERTTHVNCVSGTHSGSEPMDGRAPRERNTDVDFEWPECGPGRAQTNVLLVK